MDLELRHLKVVVAIADTGSLTKAAALLSLPQPALTAQLQRIERALGGPLFDRDRRGARPTALGELVLARARVVLPAMKDLREEAARLTDADTDAVRYRLGAVNGPIVGGLVHRLAADEPHARITTYASWSADELTTLVGTGRLDFAVVGVCGSASPRGEHGVTWRTLATDAVFVLLPQRHPLAARPEVELAALAEVHWVAAPGDGCFADCFAAACARSGFTPRTMYEADPRGCVDLVEAGDAVALCQPTFRTVPGLVTRPLAGAPLRWRLLLGWHPDAAAAQAADRVLRYAAQAYADSVARAPAYADWLARHPHFGLQPGLGGAPAGVVAAAGADPA
ncbi:MAG TPA: LysR family transcriptional regulator [Pilimelia sp.]|nr:LysR family transcriptional regulator [Pilimelia sp.]